MTKLNSYLNFDGKTEEAFNFYKSVFGGEFLGGIHRMGDMPGMKIPEEAKNRVLHVTLPIGDDVLMGSDIFPGSPLVQGNNNYISVSPDSREEADRVFAALSEGGVVEMLMQDQFWGEYFGSLQDKFGIWWMIDYRAED